MSKMQVDEIEKKGNTYQRKPSEVRTGERQLKRIGVKQDRYWRAPTGTRIGELQMGDAFVNSK